MKTPATKQPGETTIVVVNLNFGDANPHATASANGKPLEHPNPKDPEIELRVGDSLEFKSDRPFKIQISGQRHENHENHEIIEAGPPKNLFTGKDGEELEIDSQPLDSQPRNGMHKVSGKVHSSFQQVKRPCAYKYKATPLGKESIDPHIIIK
ncbi:MAG TPA: hypothetical protein VK638_40625 [Edaphobacter sp.]|nr:hypothetical protein [Edaphobacter sp.]